MYAIPFRGTLSLRVFRRKSITQLGWLFTLAGSSLAFSTFAATNMTPIAVTGWNRDVIIESNAAPPFTANAAEVAPGNGNVFYQTGLKNYVWGLPPSGNFESMVGDGTLFQFQPYTANNALVLSTETGLTSGTLTLATPTTYGLIAVVSHSVTVTNQTGALTLNFNDGTSLTTTYLSADWNSGTYAVAWFGNGMINLTTTNDTGGTQAPRYYQTTINVAALTGATNKPISSITFGQTQSAATAIYAVSGVLAGNTMAVGQPINATGYNRDLVVESNASGPPYTSVATELNPGEGRAFYQSGLPGKSYGFPANGAFSSAVDGTRFQLQPYTGNNALVMNTNTGINHGNLTLTTPAVYNSLSVIAHSASGGGVPVMTINFSDGSTLATNYNAPDWFVGNQGVALAGFERILLSNGSTEGAPGNPRFYQTTYDLAALFGPTNKPIASLTFNQAAGAGSTAVYAISGVRGNQGNGTYTLPTVSSTPASATQARAATVGGNVISTGGSVPEVFLYYGLSDGGTNASMWSQRIVLGGQAGAFSNVLSGLSPGTTYYYTFAAINPAGTAWATPSQSFQTVAPSLPSVTNFAVSNLSATAAVLAGSVLSTGGDAPAVTIFYGLGNGGNTPSSWAQSVTIPGTQNGWFGQGVSGLTANTTYYFTARAVNTAGTSWAANVQSFTTPAANVAPKLVSVLTGRNDNGRTGLNTNESMLTPANVNSNTFGKLFSYPVDGLLLAQPLILPNVTIPGKGAHNVVIAATEHDSVYALDADSNAGVNAAPLWKVSFINPGAGITPLISATDLLATTSPGFYGPEVGISGTPVIDDLTGTIYVVAKTREVAGGATNFVYRVHALDIGTGAEKFGGPVVIQGSVPGFGDGFVFPGTVNFDSFKHMNRPALLLVNGQLCVMFASHQDYPPYHGWVFTYNAYTLQPTGVFNTTPNGSGGAVWQSSSGPAADAAGNIYFETGNGNFDDIHDNYGDTVIKLASTGGLALADYFTPYNQLALNLADLDIGSAGLMLLPDSVGSAAHPHLMIAGSKTGVFWLLDRDNMGHFNPDADTQIVQEISGATRGMWVTPAYFNGHIYYCATGDNVKSFSIANAVINTTPSSQSTGTIGYPGASTCVSANGTNNGIAWLMETSGNQSAPVVLHAYNAANVAQELYNSAQNSSRDNPGNAVKYTMPTIANGKVYVGTVNTLAVYGNISFVPAPMISPNGGAFTNSVTVTLSVATNGAAIYYTLDGTVPTTNSTLYTGPFQLTNSTGLQAVAVLPGQANSTVSAASFFNSAFFGNGTGLTGQYYANTVYNSNPFTGTPLVRTDPTINFNWNSSTPDASIPSNNYTVRWTGMVQPLFNETYNFSTTTDDGVRLWVNGQLLVDHWVPQSPTTWSGSIALQALKLYSVEMDYFQAGGGAVAQLAWSSPSTTQAIIPQTQLYPFTNTLPVLFTSSGKLTNGTFSLQLSGMPGQSYVLQASSDLVHWTNVSTNLPPATIQNLVDPGVTNFPSKFYRAMQLP